MYFPSISFSDVSITPLTVPLNISVKWNVINTDLLSTVHFPACLANVISIVCCHAFMQCVTHMGSILSVFLIVQPGCMCGLYVFVFSIVLEYLLMGLLLCVCPTDPRGIV